VLNCQVAALLPGLGAAWLTASAACNWSGHDNRDPTEGLWLATTADRRPHDGRPIACSGFDYAWRPARAPTSPLQRSILSPLASLPCGLMFTQRDSTSSTDRATPLSLGNERTDYDFLSTGSSLRCLKPGGAGLIGSLLVASRQSHCQALACAVGLEAPSSVFNPEARPRRLSCPASPALDPERLDPRANVAPFHVYDQRLDQPTQDRLPPDAAIRTPRRSHTKAFQRASPMQRPDKPATNVIGKSKRANSLLRPCDRRQPERNHEQRPTEQELLARCHKFLARAQSLLLDHLGFPRGLQGPLTQVWI
jgi:hypothetical protein